MSLSSQCEIYIKKIIRGEKRGFFPYVLRGILRSISWLFRFGVFCRNWAFDRGWFHRFHPPIPIVISVGNIVAGGTGKTPVVLNLAKQLSKEFFVSIVSRGYRSPAEKFSEPLIVSKGNGPIYPASICGDEPYLLAENLAQVMMIVGKNRQKASQIAARAGAQILILDDGMQHRQIARDFEVVVVNACDPFGKGFFLPRGFLRESPYSLRRASLIVLNHIESRKHYSEVKTILSKYTAAPVVGTQFVPLYFSDPSGKRINLEPGKRIGIFCSLGHPDQFKRLMQKQEAVIVDEYFCPDHLSPSEQSLLHFAEQCSKRGADFLVCTEKDRVKLGNEWRGAIPIIWVKVALKVVEEADSWDRFIDQVKSKLV